MSILASGYLILLYTLGVAFTVLFRKFICKNTVVLSLIKKFLKHGSLSDVHSRSNQAGVTIRRAPSVLPCWVLSLLYNLAGQSDVGIIFIPCSRPP